MLTKDEKFDVLRAAELIELESYEFCCTALDSITYNMDLKNKFSNFYNKNAGSSWFSSLNQWGKYNLNKYNKNKLLNKEARVMLLLLFAKIG